MNAIYSKYVPVKMTGEMHTNLSVIATASGKSISDVVRQASQEFIDKQNAGKWGNRVHVITDMGGILNLPNESKDGSKFVFVLSSREAFYIGYTETGLLSELFERTAYLIREYGSAPTTILVAEGIQMEEEDLDRFLNEELSAYVHNPGKAADLLRTLGK